MITEYERQEVTGIDTFFLRRIEVETPPGGQFSSFKNCSENSLFAGAKGTISVAPESSFPIAPTSLRLFKIDSGICGNASSGTVRAEYATKFLESGKVIADDFRGNQNRNGQGYSNDSPQPAPEH